MSAAGDSMLLLQEIDALKEAVRVLTGRLAEVETLSSRLRDPLRFVFLARSDGAGWVEQTVNNGVVEDFPDGRKSDPDEDASHMIEGGGAFAVIEIDDVDTDGNHVTRFVPVRSASVVQVVITGTAVGGGKYVGKIVTGSVAPVDAAWLTANLAFPEVGQALPDTEDCIILNEHEDGESSHVLTNGSAASKPTKSALRIGAMPAPDGRAIVLLGAYSFFTGAP